MTIKVGDRLPESTFMTMGADGAPKPMRTAEIFGHKKVALFAVPGAYTGVCSRQHMPNYVDNYDALKKKGFDVVACTSTNDIFVLTNWAKDSKADGTARFEVDLSAAGKLAELKGKLLTLTLVSDAGAGEFIYRMP